MDDQKNQVYQNWQLHRDADHILWLTLNRQDASVNSINQPIFEELDSILSEVAQNFPAGIVILSGKPKGFIAGADIKQFVQITDEEAAFKLIRQAQIILQKLVDLRVPTVAMIRGFCLGGGLELALACRYRVAEDSLSTILGLPEVNLGLHPGWGGTVRLPKLVGAPWAMAMMLTGKPISAKKAANIGLVDAAVPERHLRRAATYYILNKPLPQKPKGFGRWSNASWIRPLLRAWFQKKLSEKVNPAYYPAPFAIINHWQRQGVLGEQPYISEARSIAHLMVGSTSRQLVRVFFLQEQLKSLAKGILFKPHHLHVIGAGTMGGDIAAWCAYKGFYVTLEDKNPTQIAAAIHRAFQLLSYKLEQPRLVQAAMDRLLADPQGFGIKKAEVVIEAAFENLAVKQQIFQSIISKLRPQVLLVTNTSSIRLEEIASGLVKMESLMGLHFFNPVSKMPLVEIVYTPQTTQEQLQMAASFVNQLGHYPLPVTSSPGFLVNRILMPYLLEAMILLEEGVAIEQIDFAAKNFGMPMGPIELADKVGLDICLSVANNLAPYYGLTVPAILIEHVKQGHLGLKSKHGFYQYTRSGKPVASIPKSNSNTQSTVILEMTDRMILRLCNEAVACLAEKVVASADMVDAGMIYGAGFAPFRGGPIQYIRTQGSQVLQLKLQKLATQFGERFKPHPFWNEII